MARRVNHGTPNVVQRYEPKAYNNRSAPLSDRVVVHYRVPTERDRRRLQSFGDSTKVIRDKDGNISVETTQDGAFSKMENAIVQQVTDVENYIGSDGNPIKTGAEFAEHGEDGFVLEIGNLLLSEIDTTDVEKKQDASVSSSSQMMKASDGIARSAPALDLSTRETATEKSQLGTLQDKGSSLTVAQSDG